MDFASTWSSLLDAWHRYHLGDVAFLGGVLALWAWIKLSGRARARVEQASPLLRPTCLATSELLKDVSGLACDPSGTVFAAASSERAVLKLTPTGELSTYAGNGEGAADQLEDPDAVVVDARGTVYVGGGSRLSTISRGQVKTLAGGEEGFIDGAGTAARFSETGGLALDRQGNLLVADWGNHCVRKVTPSGTVTTVAGNGTKGFADGTGGPDGTARFNGPAAVAVDAEGNVYVADSQNNRIRKIDLDGAVTTLAGSGKPGSKDGIGAAASFDYPCSLACRRSGDLLVLDAGTALRKVDGGGRVTTFRLEGVDDLEGLACAPDGSVVLSDPMNQRILRVAAADLDPAPPTDPVSPS